MTARTCPPWAGSCTRAWKGFSPKGADDFLLGVEGSGSWQKLTLVFWLLVGKGGGCRSRPVATSGMEMATVPLALPGQQPRCCSANCQMLLHWVKIALLSIQRRDNGLFSSQNTGEKVCEHQMCRLLFPSYIMRMKILSHPAALKQGNKQPVLIIELHIA